jgi:pilus assembly protein Flp/PilA
MMHRKLLQLGRDIRGANMVEYIILVGLVAIVGFAAFRLFGTNVSTSVTGQAQTVGAVPTSS